MISANLIKQLKSAGYEEDFGWDMIKECGDEFWMLEYFPDGMWVAYSVKNIPGEDAKTPEEAVAKLLLKLLKK